MLTAVATVTADAVSVHFVAADEGTESGENQAAETDLNPIAPEVKEMVWGFGSFAVLAILMRYWLYPRLRKGMDARYEVIKGGHEQAEQVTDAARADVAQYEAQLATIKAEAQQRIEAARAVLDGERSERLADVSTRIGEKRAAAATAVEQARTAAQADVEAAVRSVASRAGELATGRTPTPDVVNAAVADVMSAGVSR
ncbi:MAG: ATP synthase F0 subunit B [Ilumatobacteraceae bacterium]